MKKEILTRCGYRCDLCLAYQPNVKKNDERQKLSDGWYKFFGFRIDPEKIICYGCMADDTFERIDKQCPVRPCVIKKNIDNCAFCAEFICKKLKERIVDFAEVKKRYDKEISVDEYKCFIKPYESMQRLDDIRKKRWDGSYK